MDNNLGNSSLNSECGLILKKKPLFQVYPLRNENSMRQIEGVDKSLRNTQKSHRGSDEEPQIEIQKKRKKFKRRSRRFMNFSSSEEK